MINIYFVLRISQIAKYTIISNIYADLSYLLDSRLYDFLSIPKNLSITDLFLKICFSFGDSFPILLMFLVFLLLYAIIGCYPLSNNVFLITWLS